MNLPKFGVKQARSLKVGDSLLVRKGRGKNPNGSIHTTACKEGISITVETVYLVVPSTDELFNISLVTRIT